jgi:aminoglycoside phosphotransferase family enzyme
MQVNFKSKKPNQWVFCFNFKKVESRKSIFEKESKINLKKLSKWMLRLFSMFESMVTIVF